MAWTGVLRCIKGGNHRAESCSDLADFVKDLGFLADLGDRGWCRNFCYSIGHVHEFGERKVGG